MNRRRWLVGLAVAAAGLATAATIGRVAPAIARSEKTLAYPTERVFPAAVRFLRIDEGVKLTEKDADAGYVLFELAQDGKVFPGALEMIAAESAGRPAVRLVLRVEDRPSYVEQAMLERLERKLRSELGSEPPPVKPAPAPGPGKPGEKPGGEKPGGDEKRGDQPGPRPQAP